MKLFDLTGRVALITGGNGGLGLGMGRGLAQAGAAIMVAGRNEAKNAAAVETLRALGAKAESLVMDVTDEASCRAGIDETARRMGGLNILVNNAGMSVRKPPQDLTFAEWRQVLSTNLDSAFVCSHAAYPHLKKQGGKIINTGSLMSVFGAPFAIPYAASKGGLLLLSKALATAWAKDNIQVNTIIPGWLDTELTVNARAQVQGLYESVLERTPAGRWGNPDDLQGVAVFLASAASDFVTGAQIAVDGGLSAKA
ncbi:MAG: SDR family NAD(P)-dependent oxidoreductase [Alphaproteobacteria bacterium]